MISIHLSDQEITAAAAGERLSRTTHHLQICSDCQQQVEIYRDLMVSLRQDVCYSAGRSAIAWGRQSRAIQQSILIVQMKQVGRRGTGFALAGALALVLIFVAIEFRNPPATAPPAHTTIAISDSALLNDVEAQLDEDLPDALQPASLLVGEMGGIDGKTTTNSNSRTHTRNAQ